MAPARRKGAARKRAAADDANTVRDGATEDHEGVVDGALQGPADGGDVGTVTDDKDKDEDEDE